MRTIECFEEIEATIGSGVAFCVFPPDLCNHVPIRLCADTRRGMMFKTASGQKVAHAGIRIIERSTECGLTRRLTGAVTPAQKIFLAVSRLAKTGHQVQFTRTGRMNETAQDPNALEEWSLHNQVLGER